MAQSLQHTYPVSMFQKNLNIKKLTGGSTIDFHITAKCSQACPYCWGPRRFRSPVDTETALHIITRIKGLGVRRIVFTTGDPLRRYPNIDVKVATPVTHHNLRDVPAIAQLVDEYSHTTQASVYYNIFQAFPRAIFSVKWETMIVSDEDFSALKEQVGTKANVRINFLDHKTLDKLYVMIFPDGSMTIPKGGDYLNFGPFLDVKDYEQVLNDSQFDSVKHLRHSRGWGKGSLPVEQSHNRIRI